MTREDRELLIYNAWGLDGSDEIFYLLPEDLMSELLDYDEPQEDIMSSKYDELVRLISELSYGQYSNEKLPAVERKLFGNVENMIFAHAVVGRTMELRRIINIAHLII